MNPLTLDDYLDKFRRAAERHFDFSFMPDAIHVASSETNRQVLRIWLFDSDPVVREFSALVLGRLKDLLSIEPLLHACEAWDSHKENSSAELWALRRAIEALGAIGSPRANALLKRLMQDSLVHDEEEAVALYALSALEKIGDAELPELIRPLTTHPDIDFRKAAKRILAKYTELHGPAQNGSD